MDLFLAISQGIGTSLATGVRALLVPLVRGRAGARRTSASTSSGTELRVPRVGLVARAAGGAGRGRVAARPLRRRASPDGDLGRRRRWRLGSGAAVRGLARGRGLLRRRPGIAAGRRRARCSAFIAARAFLGGAAERLARAARAARSITAARATSRALALGGARGAGPARSSCVAVAFCLVGAARAQPPPRRTEVRRPPHPSR